MELARTDKNVLGQVLEARKYEQDEGFHEIILLLNQRGMIAAGLLGVVAVVINISVNLITGNAFVIWDKLVVFILSVGLIVLSRYQFGKTRARLIASLMAVASVAAIIIDDFGQDSVYVSHHYVGVLVLLLVTALPFYPLQAVGLDVIVAITYVITSLTVSRWLDVQGQVLTTDAVVYLAIVFAISIGLSATIYIGRYRLYRQTMLNFLGPPGHALRIAQPRSINVRSDTEKFLAKVNEVIEREMSNSQFGVDQLADEVALSRRQLERKLRALSGLAPGGYIRTMRLRRSVQLLDQDYGPIGHIAREVGFRDASYFSRSFKTHFGVSPKEYLEIETVLTRQSNRQSV